MRVHKVKLFSATHIEQLLFSVRPLQAAETPQRVYVIFLALCVCCTLFEAVCCDNIAWPKQVDIFVSEETQVPVKVGDVEHNVTIKLVDMPFFILADNVMVVFVREEYSHNGHRNANIIAKYIETEGDNWTRRITENNGSNWKTQVAIQKEIQSVGSDFVLYSPTTAANENNIYLFSVNFNLLLDNEYNYGIQSFEFELAMGKVKTNFTAQSADEIIEWQKLKQPSVALTETLERKFPNAMFYPSSAFVTKNKSFIFIFTATISDKDASVFVNSNNAENATKWEVSYVYTPKGCYDPHIVLWGSELMMFSNRCPHGNQAVMKSTDMGKTWTTAEQSFVRLLDNLNDKNDLTVATINNKTALLCIQKKVNDTASEEKYEIYLWVSDGNRIRNIGLIAADNKNIYFTGLAYTNGELFFMYQQIDLYGLKKSIVSHLDVEGKKITSILNIWDKTDKYLSQPCNKTATQNAQSAAICATSVSTDGLVGFLSGSSNNNTYWHDEYLYMNATVKGGTKINNGFTFSGFDAGAKWKLEQNEQIPYRVFAHYGMTVVATVKIHSALGNKTPLLTVGSTERSVKKQGLWYGNDRQWKVVSEGNNEAISAVASGWETNKTYRVALVVRKNIIAAYVDGMFVGGDVLRTFVYEESTFMSLYIFISGYEDNDVESKLINVTVTNVLLYNRQLNETEMREMSSNLES